MLKKNCMEKIAKTVFAETTFLFLTCHYNTFRNKIIYLFINAKSIVQRSPIYEGKK